MVKKTTKLTILFHICSVVGIIGAIVLCVYGYKTGLFSSEESLNAFLQQLGVWGPLVFVLLQVVQVVIPIIPGGISCVVGVLVFGPWMGFWYNYIGICIGSILNFLLARKYGTPFIRMLVPERLYNKYSGWLNKGKVFDRTFAIAIFFPVAPDDFLCMLAGLTEMKFRRFLAIILLGKPASIALYSMGLTAVLNWIAGHFA